MKKERGGVYIHVPFCKQKCFYCDFPSQAGKERYEAAYIDALIKEIQTEGANYVDRYGPPATIYIGGGTPSVLPCRLLATLLDFVEQNFLLRTQLIQKPLPQGEDRRGTQCSARSGSPAGQNNAHDVTPRGCAHGSDVWGRAHESDIWGRARTGDTKRCTDPNDVQATLSWRCRACPSPEGKALGVPEFTIECNPGTVTEEKLRLMKSHAVTRLSFGVQTFHDDLLRRIGRIHTAEQARQAIRLARAAGFTNVNLDLMYGLPGETLAMLQSDIDEALALAPDHISIYGLQLEEGTAFWKMNEMGKLHLPDDDMTEAMYDLMTTALPAHGYARYEISNFAKPGCESRHNLGYWQDQPYLGLGAAAHSYLDGVRYENTKDITAYIEAIEHGELPRTQEEPATRAIRMEEFAFLALRTARGIDKTRFEEKFGVALASVYADVVARMQQKGLLEETEESVHLTPLGMKYGNYVFSEFLLTP